MRHRLPALLLLFSFAASAQLTPDQKRFDMQSLASIYAKRYGPYDWKKTAFQFDLFNVAPWLDRAANTANDLDFYEVLVEYVASLNDTHDHYLLPSIFTASLNMTLDIYDGRVLIDSVNRIRLPAAAFPFQAGDEIVSVDGTASADLLAGFSKYVIQANPRSTMRRAAAHMALRRQSQNPYAAQIGDTASVVIRRQNGNLETYTIPWIKSGLPLTQVGPIPTPQSVRYAESVDDDLITPLLDLQTSRSPMPEGELGNGSLFPLFALPADFKIRRGGNFSTDLFYSGTFQSQGLTIGFIRVPTYGPADTVAALTQFQQEIAYMQANTDGLIVDEMRNPGGSLCYGEDITAQLMPATFRPMGYEIRATWEYVNSYYARLQSALAGNAPQSIVDQYQMLSDAMLAAYNTNRGRTDALPLCTGSFSRPAPTDSKGAPIAYSKPVIMLIDEFSTSTADSVPAMFQDNKRGLLVGWRTNGGGGSNSLNISSWQVGSFSEGTTGVTLSLMSRKDTISTPEFPDTKYIENVGVRPDVQIDYMTLDNLLNGGRPFFQAVTNVMVQQIQAGRS